MFVTDELERSWKKAVVEELSYTTSKFEKKSWKKWRKSSDMIVGIWTQGTSHIKRVEFNATPICADDDDDDDAGGGDYNDTDDNDDDNYDEDDDDDDYGSHIVFGRFRFKISALISTNLRYLVVFLSPSGKASHLKLAQKHSLPKFTQQS